MNLAEKIVCTTTPEKPIAEHGVPFKVMIDVTGHELRLKEFMGVFRKCMEPAIEFF